jgi:hypothetical protein
MFSRRMFALAVAGLIVLACSTNNGGGPMRRGSGIDTGNGAAGGPGTGDGPGAGPSSGGPAGTGPGEGPSCGPGGSGTTVIGPNGEVIPVATPEEILTEQPPDEPSSCEPATCYPEGGQYCGELGDGCGGQLECNDPCRETGWVCSEDGLCVGGSDCAALTSSACTPEGATYCEEIGDLCGGSVDCGMCPAGLACQGRVCPVPNSVPLICDAANRRYCGEIGDA